MDLIPAPELRYPALADSSDIQDLLGLGLLLTPLGPSWPNLTPDGSKSAPHLHFGSRFHPCQLSENDRFFTFCSCWVSVSGFGFFSGFSVFFGFLVFLVSFGFFAPGFLSGSGRPWPALAGPGRPWQATAGPGRLRQALAGLSLYVRVRSAPACPSQPSTGPAAAIRAIRG